MTRTTAKARSLARRRVEQRDRVAILLVNLVGRDEPLVPEISEFRR